MFRVLCTCDFLPSVGARATANACSSGLRTRFLGVANTADGFAWNMGLKANAVPVGFKRASPTDLSLQRCQTSSHTTST